MSETAVKEAPTASRDQDTDTAIQVLWDRSGSMGENGLKEASEEGLRSFLNEQRGIPGRCTVRLCQFDDRYEVVHGSLPISEVPDPVLVPRGGTALMDAWGRTMVDFGKELDGCRAKPDVVIFIVVTDGKENSSREWTQEMIHSTVKAKEQQGWRFLYLGANQDAVKVGMDYGVRPENAITYAASGPAMASAYTVVSDVTTSSRTGVTRGFTDKERQTAAGN